MFGKNTCYEGFLTNGRYFACEKIGRSKQKIYFFQSDKGFHVRDYLFFGTLDEYVDYIQSEYSETAFLSEYMTAIELAKIVLERMGRKVFEKD